MKSGIKDFLQVLALFAVFAFFPVITGGYSIWWALGLFGFAAVMCALGAFWYGKPRK